MGIHFPNPRHAPDCEPLGMGGRLSVEWLLTAYRQGIFPWFGEGEPVYWWCPNPRFALRPSDLKVSRSLRKEVRKSRWSVTFDRAFPMVIDACASVKRVGQEGTWIIDEMKAAYIALHEQGFAHSVECWFGDELVGGLYGVSLGTVFFGESMFHHVPNASKVAFVRLVERLVEWEFELIDCQQPTAYLRSFGAYDWNRDDFLDTLDVCIKKTTRSGPWVF